MALLKLCCDKSRVCPNAILVLSFRTMPFATAEARAKYNKDYRARNRIRRSALRPTHDRVRHANRRAALYGVSGRITVEDVRAVLPVGVRCHWCGRSAEEIGATWPQSGRPRTIGIDHLAPLSEGGINERSNLVPSCHGCNSSKFRNDQPGRWSRDADSCLDCGTLEVPHLSRGLCGVCYGRRKRSGTLAERPKGTF